MELKLIKMGCNILEQEKENTDLTNYRYWLKNLELKKAIKVTKNVYNENTKKYENKDFIIDKIDVLEIGSGARYDNGKKKIDMWGCWFDTEYTIESGSYRLLDLEKELNIKNWNSSGKTYNKQFILDTINSISKNEYTNIAEINYSDLEDYLVFKLHGKEIMAYTIRGTFGGEKQATIELLAYENNCKESEIETFIEKR